MARVTKKHIWNDPKLKRKRGKQWRHAKVSVKFLLFGNTTPPARPHPDLKGPNSRPPSELSSYYYHRLREKASLTQVSTAHSYPLFPHPKYTIHLQFEALVPRFKLSLSISLSVNKGKSRNS